MGPDDGRLADLRARRYRAERLKSAAEWRSKRYSFRLDVLLEALEERGGLDVGTATLVLYGGRDWKEGSGRAFSFETRRALEAARRFGFAERVAGEPPTWRITAQGIRRRRELELSLTETEPLGGRGRPRKRT